MPEYSYNFDGHYGIGYVYGSAPQNGVQDTITLTFTEALNPNYYFVSIYGDTEGPADIFNVTLPDGWSISHAFTNDTGTNDQQYFYVLDGGGGQRMQFSFIGQLGTTCFTHGAMIETDTGPVAIDALTEGALVRTRDNGLQPIRWIGSTTLSKETLEQFPHLRPVHIAEGALGSNRAQSVSPDHRMLIERWQTDALFGQAEVLATAKSLINGSTIRAADNIEDVEYFHILFDSHQIICADGGWSESFHPAAISNGNASMATRDEVLTIFPELERDMALYGPAIRATLEPSDVQVLLG